LTLIIIVTYAVLTIINQFNKAFYKLINNLEEQNTELQAHRENLEGLVAERSADLEAANEELTTINDELNQSNIIIETQNLQLKSTLEHLKETQAKLVQSEKMASLGVLSAGVAHEINNPLNFIMGGYVGLESYFNAPNESKRNNIPIYLGSIKTGLKQASDIVQALGIFSRGNLSYSEKCDIHSIIDGCLMKLSNQYNDRIEISKEYCSESATTTGNVSMLNQVFLNILTNSIHAIDKNGKISIKTSVKIESIIVEISDSGCGISNESLQKITDPFFTTKDPGKGVGLGLSIAYTIIMEHNGEIDFKSEIGKGTTAIVKIPVKHNTQDEN
jgi:signal transduction histidine kinase